MCENLNYHVQRFQKWYLYTKQAANLGCPFESLYLEKKSPCTSMPENLSWDFLTNTNKYQHAQPKNTVSHFSSTPLIICPRDRNMIFLF